MIRNYIFRLWHHHRWGRCIPGILKKWIRFVTGSAIKHPAFPFNIEYFISEHKKIHFAFFASAKMGEKAKRDGVENIITRSIYRYTAPLTQGLILDVGMNYGFLSAAWATALPQHQIIGFEVSPSLLEAVRKTIHLNHLGNLILEQRAVSDITGTVLEFSFLPGKAARKSHTGQTGLVQTITLDDYLQEYTLPVHAIKIDTDGFDYEVLLGARKTIHKHRPFVVVETNNDPRIISFFLEEHYHIYSMRQTPVTSADIDLKVPEYVNILCYPSPMHI